MRFVERADIRPMRCAVCPSIGQSHLEGFIDTGAEMLPAAVEQRVYVSVAAVRELNRVLGWPTPTAHEALQAERDELAKRLEDAETDLKETQQFMDAIDVIESRDFRARRKPGRPKKQPEGVQV